jgi:hypothetical protein
LTNTLFLLRQLYDENKQKFASNAPEYNLVPAPVRYRLVKYCRILALRITKLLFGSGPIITARVEDKINLQSMTNGFFLSGSGFHPINFV